MSNNSKKINQGENEKRDINAGRSAKKLMRSESEVYLILKIVLLIPFLYSGFFWGLIAAINLMNGGEYKNDAVIMLVGICLGLVGIIICFFRLYIIQFIFTLSSTILYMVSANSIVGRTIAQEADGLITVDERGKYLSDALEIRHYPYIFFGIFALMLFAWKVVQIITERKEKIERERNAPTKSILE